MKRAIQALSMCCTVLFASAALAEPLAATDPITDKERQILFPSRQLLDQGRGVAATACADCHGLNGIAESEDKPHLAGQRSVYLYRALQAYQAGLRGATEMGHSVSFLNDDALLAVAAYYAHQTPASVDSEAADAEMMSAIQEEDPFTGIRDDLRKCSRCHGEDGNSAASGMPSLTSQSPEYFVAAMKAYASGEREHRIMERLASGLDEQTLEQMGVFYAVQTPITTSTEADGDAEQGSELTAGCANCHGASGNASGEDMPSIAGQDPRYFVKAMEAYRKGEREHEGMVNAAEGLSDSDLANLAAYYAVQEPQRRDVRAPFTPAEWLERCERCHGIEGNSSDPRFPMLAGQNKAYLEKALRAYIDDKRPSTTMHAMSRPLSGQDIERIVSYYSTREPKAVVYMQLPCEETEN